MKNKFVWKTPHIAAFVAFVYGLLVHYFTLVNPMHNHDSIGTPVGLGVGISSGRWFLEYLEKIVSKILVQSYNLTWLNGILYLMLLAVTVYFLVDTLEIDGKLPAVLTAVALVSFPTAAATLFYRFTSVYYGLAMLFAVLSAWVLKKYKYGLPLSALLSTLGLGIYQAYLPLTVGIFVLILLRQVLTGEEKVRTLFLRGVYCCISIIIGIAAYVGMSKLSASFAGIAIDGYQGLDEMGKLDLRELPGQIVNAYVTFFTAPAEGYRLIQNTFMKIMYLAVLCLSVIAVIYLLIRGRKKYQQMLFAAFLCLMFPLAVNLITVMSPKAYIYTLVVYPFVLVLILPVLLLDILLAQERGWFGKLGQRAIVLVLAALICCNTYFTNVNYQTQYYAARQMENYVSGMVTQIRMTEGFDTDKKWCFVGYASDPLLDNVWIELQQHFGYGGNSSVYHLLWTYSWQGWINQYVGYKVPLAEGAEADALRESEAVAQMPRWPDYGSIQVIDDYIVIKLQ